MAIEFQLRVKAVFNEGNGIDAAVTSVLNDYPPRWVTL